MNNNFKRTELIRRGSMNIKKEEKNKLQEELAMATFLKMLQSTLRG
jgi:hypothetical protein